MGTLTYLSDIITNEFAFFSPLPTNRQNVHLNCDFVIELRNEFMNLTGFYKPIIKPNIEPIVVESKWTLFSCEKRWN